MKHLFLSFILASASLLSFSFSSIAQDIPGDDGEEIIINIDEPGQQNGLGRDLGTVPFTVTLLRTLACIEVDFLNNVGEVTITLTNMISGSFVTTLINSSFGEAIVPISLGSGLYRINLITSGDTYYGYFVLF